MSAFDDLLDLGDSSQSNQGSDPFDPFGPGQTTNQNEGNSGGDLLDLGFDAQISTENGSSGKVNFEANTNPLYEFTNLESNMENEPANPLLDFNNEPVQKDVKSEPSNLLYEYMQNEGHTNGHAEDGLTNGGELEVDLLGGEDLGGGEKQNVIEDSGDLLGNSGPVISDDSGVTEDANNTSETQPGEVIQTRSRSSSESSEPEQDIEEGAQKPTEPVSESNEVPETQEQTSGPVDGQVEEGPIEKQEEIKPVENDVEEAEDGTEAKTNTEVLDEGTSETKADFEPAKEAESEQTVEDNQNDVTDHDSVEVDNQEVFEPVSHTAVEKEPEIEPETKEQVDENINEVVEEKSNAKEDEVKESGTEQEQELEEVVPSESKEAEVSNEAEEVTPADKAEPELNKEVENKISEEPEQEIPVNIDEATFKEEPALVETEAPQNEYQAAPEETAPVEEPEPEVTAPVEEPVPVETAPVEEPEPEVTAPVEEPVPVETAPVEEPEPEPDATDLGDEDVVAVGQKTATTAETRDSVPEENALKVNGTSEVSENGVPEEDAVRDPNVLRETWEKEEVHFAEMSSFREKFESGGKSNEEQAPRRVSVKDEYDQGGEFENEPVQNPDVVKETDKSTEELPEVGSAKSLVNRFTSIQEEKAQPVASVKRPSPPRESEKVEYESQPAEHLPQYEGQVESGVFESEPKGHEDVVRSGDQAEDYKPEEGYAKNILNRFKEIQTESSQHKAHEKREITPDRSGKVEYVSEPRGEHIVYNEAQTESGVFENVPKEEEDVVRSGEKADEILPEAGSAKSLLSKFKQMETEVGNRPPPSPKRETPKKAEFVNSPRGYLEKYEPQVEAGEFENQPAERGEVVRSEDQAEEVLPEAGSAKKTMERFREIQKQSSSPVSSKAKEITPPREQSPGRNVTGVFESTPATREDVVKSGEVQPDELPEQGTTRNILNRFKEIQTSGSQSSSPGRKPKEFTPPPEAGVYENKPQEHLVIESGQSESGIIESTPAKSVADVAREREATPESELPEQGLAKNLVSKWKQLESTSSSAKSTSSTSPRFKEFTPPRDSRGPMSPKSPAGVTNGVHPSDLPGQYQPQESTVIHENKPEVKEDVYREADTDWTDGMPAPNTTASMLQRFKSIQEDAKANEKTPEPIHRKDDTPPSQPDTEEKMEVENTNQEPEILGAGDVEVVIEELNGGDDKMEEANVEIVIEELNSGDDKTGEGNVDVVGEELNGGDAKAEEADVVDKTDGDKNEEVENVDQVEDEQFEIINSVENEEVENDDDEKEDKGDENIVNVEDTGRSTIENVEIQENDNKMDDNVDVLKERDNEIDIKERDNEFDRKEEVKEKIIDAPVVETKKAQEVPVKDIPNKEENKENGGIPEPNNNTVKASISKFGAPVKRKEKGMFKVVQTEKCAACQKTVYAMEKLEMNGHIYHKNCFKCSHCSARLTAKTFSMNEGVIYCVNHFKQLFARKGNYDEGFGRQQYKKKWQDEKQEGATA